MRSDPSRKPPNTLAEKLECIRKGNPYYKKFLELKKKHGKSNTKRQNIQVPTKQSKVGR